MKSERRSQLIITLRHNIEIESDVSLAEDEIVALCMLDEKNKIHRLSTRTELTEALKRLDAPDRANRLLTHCLRKNGAVAFLVNGATFEQAEDVLLRCAFGQEVLFASPDQGKPSRMARKLSRTDATSGKNGYFFGITLASVLDYSSRMVFHREKTGSASLALDALVDYLLDESQPNNSLLEAINSAITAKRTTLYLTHELHLYKGKFFPRMVRSLINRFAPNLKAKIVDPFIGSGTTLLDAALLGYDSLGIDVDPTSVLISQQKLTPAQIDSASMQDACLGIQAAVYGGDRSLFSASTYTLRDWKKFSVSAPEPMRGRLIKRGNEEGYDLLGEIEGDSAKALCLISQLPSEIQPLMRVCLSHALTKKLRLRFVGIGNGRFTIDVAKVGVLDLFVKKAFHLVAISEVFEWLKRSGLKLADTEVIRGSAKDLKALLGARKADLIITSPPYIPASSGREHYARARAIPLVFTGAATLKELDRLDEAFIGEMSAQQDTLHLEKGMPPAVRSTLQFLRTNEQRLPKYLPTLNYYVDLAKVLENVRECLTDQGKALFVVGTSHTFYIHKTKEILHTVDAAKAMAELGVRAGLEVTEVINIPLKKSGGLNARPRSTDDYSESVVVFKKSSQKKKAQR